MAYSYSGIKAFGNCQRQYYETKILKKWPFPETKAIMYGKEVHKALEDCIKDNKPLGPHTRFQPVVDALNNVSGEKLTELEMALDDNLEPCGFMDEKAFIRGIADIVVLDKENKRAYVGDYKGLALDTKLPTPNGFTTMRDVQEGDVLFSESGEQCTVVGKSKVKHLKSYKITFNDTNTVVCDEEHLWKTTTGDVIGVHELMGRHNGKQRIAIPKIAVAAPLALPDVCLPIDPYVLGVWIADGKHTSGEISKPDDFIWEEIQRRGYPVNMATGGKKSCPTRTVQGLSAQLKKTGLLKNKHIPALYLRAGYTQRLDLLRGLMDGDGSANLTRKQCVYSTTDEALAMQVKELLSTLGQKGLVSTVTAYGFGLTVTAYPVSFKPVGINPFLLPRKKDIVTSTWAETAYHYRYAVRVEEIDSVPTQCIAVDSPDKTFLCTEAMIPTHNTGSAKYPDTDQLELMALMIFRHYPEVDHVKAALLFIVHDVVVTAKYHRKEAKQKWMLWLKKIEVMEDAARMNIYQESPSGLCPWCPVTDCPHWKPKKRYN